MDNTRGAVLMVLAMLFFAVEDMLIKLMSASLPVGQIMVALGLGGGLGFLAIAAFRRAPLVSRDLLHPGVIARTLTEAFGAIAFVYALTLIPISTTSAILQATPLVVTLGAALFLGETVGWRRWSAICVGLLGVLMIIRPGFDAFDARALLPLIAVVALAMRDLITRRLPAKISSIQISLAAFAAQVPVGLLVLAMAGDVMVVPDRIDGLRIVAAVGIGILAYLAIVGATRIGDLSAISPYRYSRLVFALVIGVIVFAERPDALTLTGAAIIVLSGLYTLWREARARPASLATEPLV